MDKNLRIQYFRNYFKENNFSSITQCIEIVKEKFGKEIEINEDIKKEINSAKVLVLVGMNTKTEKM